MSNPTLMKNFLAEAAIPAYRLVKLGTADGKVTTAVAATDLIVGPIMDVSPAIGERVDVVMVGIAYIEAGAAITRGSLVTSDSVGRCVTAAPAAGANNRCIGVAVEAATAAGDIITVQISPSMMQG